MDREGAQTGETVDSHAPTIISAPPGDPAMAPAEMLVGVGPQTIVDLMLGCPMWRAADLVVLQPMAGRHELLVKRRSNTLAKLALESDVGDASVARLSLLAGLDPFSPRGSCDEGANVARMPVRSGSDIAEVLVTVAASAHGLEAEIRALTLVESAVGPPSLQRCGRCGAIQGPGHGRCALDDGPLEPAVDSPVPGGAIGAWRLVESLGTGATGQVFAAEHALIGRRGAVKVLHASLLNAPMVVRRFLAEARAACRLRHPNVVEVTDFGLLATGQPYVVMERLWGRDLARVLADTPALTPLAAIRIAREIASALEAAHEAGIVHNDLKPENVVMLEDSTEDAPRLKVVDFGACSLADLPDDAGYLYGTPQYIAPERIRSAGADGRADLYALGVIVFEMVAGAQPFTGETTEALFSAHLNTPAPAVTSPYGPLPASITRLVERALRKAPDERHQTATELLLDLDRAAADLGRADWRRWLP